NQRNRVSPQRLSHGTTCLGFSDSPGDPGIGASFTVWDRLQGLVNLTLKISPAASLKIVPRNRPEGLPTLEIGAELFADTGRRRETLILGGARGLDVAHQRRVGGIVPDRRVPKPINGLDALSVSPTNQDATDRCVK